MARGKKSGGRNFEKGNPGGPGQPPLPPDVKKARKLNAAEFTRVATEYLYFTKDELKKKATDPATPIIELLVGSIVAKAVEHGDSTRLEMLLNRLIGKVTDKIKHELPKATVVQLYGEEAVLVLGSESQEEGGSHGD